METIGRSLPWCCALVILAALHGGAARADTPPPPDAAALAALDVAAVYGRTLGAASECPAIPSDRVDAIARKAQAHLRLLAPRANDQATVGQRFSDALYQGASDVRDGQTICAQAEADLGNLDHELPEIAAGKPGASATSNRR
jgi:hypothetical protein